MSVFSDFEIFKEMWQTRFPGQRLSDAWEEMLKLDVQASLTRHTQKISDLKKELETEKLYVEYLERLLSDVEKYRESGENGPSPTQNELDNLGSSDRKMTDEKSDTVIKAPTNNNNNSQSNGSTTDDDKTKEDNFVQLRQNDPITQCINELTSNLNLRRCFSEINEKTNVSLQNSDSNKVRETDESKSRRSSQGDQLSSPSHFVTVIEVKESAATPTNTVSAITTAAATTVTPAATPVVSSGVRGAIGSYENVIIEKKSSSAAVASHKFSAHKENVIKEEKEQCDEPNVSSFKATPITNTNANDDKKVSAASISLADRKKVPPRPPPKYPRRAGSNFIEPPTVPINASPPSRRSNEPASTTTPFTATTKTTSSSLERNIKPSELFRQKSSDSLDIKLSAVNNRKTQPADISKFSKSSDLAGEFEKKLAKSESMKSNQSSTGSLSGVTASPTGSLGKTSQTRTNINNSNNNNDSPNGSLGKTSSKANESLLSVGSRESLASGGINSGIMKSYESISSLSSDSIQKAGHRVDIIEPFYDTVPLDNNGDGEYCYIQAGGTGSTSSRDDISMAGSTLPMPRPRSQSSLHVLEPESPGRSSNYVNIDYFLQHSTKVRTSSADSDNELDAGGPPPPLLRAISVDSESSRVGDSVTTGLTRSVSNASRKNIIRQIISSIINSETLYVECLNKMRQYKKAICATLTTSQPVISEEDFNTIFFKIEDLHEVHSKFLDELRHKHSVDSLSVGGDLLVGEIFKKLTSHVHLYGAFLHNYGRAIDTVKKCGAHSVQFKEIVSKIIMNSTNEQSLTLEDLLHKPVARVQKNSLVMQDLLNQTPESHPDYQPLRMAHTTIRNFLSEFNVIQTKTMFPNDDKALRRLVKNSFIVELVDGHRKLRHLFLFNDVIACAKYKASGRDKFEFELKWFISLKDIIICEESAIDPKEASPINIVQLKSQACTVRDQILLDDKQEKKSRTGDKHRKKLADLEGQLVLASPNLVFKICNRSNSKAMTFFLSSDYERTHWIESILTLQQSCSLPGTSLVHIYELQAWITACQALIKTEMGSYLMRNSRDESLLVGDLHLTIQRLIGLEQPADLFVCVEVDSYGHYFRKAKTKLVCRSNCPQWNESFVLELEGSQNLRVLLYQDDTQRPILRAKHVVKLSRNWLQEKSVEKPLKLSDTVALNTAMRFVPGSKTLSRVPTSKPGALFGAKLLSVLKREKRDIPFIISACIREVERRGMSEVGIYRVSGSASDLAKLKKSFETNSYEAEQLLKEVDIHSATGILKSYLRELPEALFTDNMYPKFVEAFNHRSHTTEAQRGEGLMVIFAELSSQNRSTINLILEHLMRVHQQEAENKMSLHNLAMVFGPTLLRPGPSSQKQKDLLESSTVDVMAQAGILYAFLQFLSDTRK